MRVAMEFVRAEPPENRVVFDVGSIVQNRQAGIGNADGVAQPIRRGAGCRHGAIVRGLPGTVNAELGEWSD